jgi:hypothetical protein
MPQGPFNRHAIAPLFHFGANAVYERIGQFNRLAASSSKNAVSFSATRAFLHGDYKAKLTAN